MEANERQFPEHRLRAGNPGHASAPSRILCRVGKVESSYVGCQVGHHPIEVPSRFEVCNDAFSFPLSHLPGASPIKALTHGRHCDPLIHTSGFLRPAALLLLRLRGISFPSHAAIRFEDDNRLGHVSVG